MHEYIVTIINPHMTGGMSVMSLFANPQTLDKCVLGLCTLHPVKPKVSHICNAKSHYTENYYINSESGINFQVKLKHNYTKRNYVKQDLTVSFMVCLVPSGHTKQ